MRVVIETSYRKDDAVRIYAHQPRGNVFNQKIISIHHSTDQTFFRDFKDAILDLADYIEREHE